LPEAPDFTRSFIPGISIKVGCQDMAFGEGLMLQDGSAVDGPRTGYLNAVDMMMRDCEMESERNLRGFGPAPEVVHPSY